MIKNHLLLIIFSLLTPFWCANQVVDTALIRVYSDSTLTLSGAGKSEDAIQLGLKTLSLYEQNYSEPDSFKVAIYNAIGNAYKDNSALDSSMYFLNKSLSLIEKLGLEKSLMAAETNRILGRIYYLQYFPEKALEYYQKTIALNILNLGEHHSNIALNYKSLGYVFIDQGKYDKALEYFDKGMKLQVELLGETDSTIASFYISIGFVYYIRGHYEKALEYYKEALEIKLLVDEKNYNDLGYFYNEIAVTYYSLGKFKLALIAYKKSIKNYLKVLDENHSSLVNPYTNLGILYHYMGKYKKAKEYFEKNINITINTYGESHPNLAINYNNLATIYGEENKTILAIEYLQMAIRIYLETPASFNDKLRGLYLNMSILLTKQGEFKLAMEYCEKALLLHLDKFDDTHPKMAKIYTYFGHVYKEQHENNKALFYYKKALNIRLKMNQTDTRSIGIVYTHLASVYNYQEKYDSTNIVLNQASDIIGYDPSNPFNFSSTLHFQVLNTILLEKIKMYKGLGHRDSIDLLYQVRLSLYDQIYATTPNSFFQHGDVESLFSFYEEAIENNFLKQNDDSFKQAFQIMEKSKMRELTIQLQKTDVQNYVNIPDSLLVKEYKLSTDITYYNKKKFQAQYEAKEQKDSLLNLYKNKLFNLKREQENFIETLKENHPDYHRLKYDNTPVEIDKLQQTLQENQALVEYFVGDSSIYIFVISKEQFELKQIKRDFPLDSLIDDLRQGIYNYWMMSDLGGLGYKESQEKYKTAAYQLYEKLFQPIASLLPEKLIIVPDNKLNLIPFDALLTESTSLSDYGNLSYLIKTHQISYNYSATLFDLLQSQPPSIADESVLSVAPYFKGPGSPYRSVQELRTGYSKLPFNKEEAETISDLLNGTALVGEQATKQGFLDRAEKYKILHLATHSKSNDALGDFSYIAFPLNSDSIADNSRLYAQELYNVHLNADMVVLSACESGLGQLSRGEGIVGLARAFTYAGAQSTVTSLWSVSDMETTELMKFFYNNLQKGMAKDKALRQAKLTYLSTADRKAPFFWASFIPSGNMDPIQLDSGNKYRWFMLAASFLILLGVGFYKYKKF